MSNEQQDWVWENRRECKRAAALLEEAIAILEELAGSERKMEEEVPKQNEETP